MLVGTGRGQHGGIGDGGCTADDQSTGGRPQDLELTVRIDERAADIDDTSTGETADIGRQLDHDPAGRITDREQRWRPEPTRLCRDHAARRDDRANRQAAHGSDPRGVGRARGRGRCGR